jgi:glycosyltransferase involved in cell wall biosynthesis
MRIAFVYDTVYPESKGGVEKRVWELARRLARRGHRVHLLVPKAWDGPDSIERDGVVLEGVCSARPLYTSRGRRAVWPAIAHAIGVYHHLRKERFDLVDCQIPAHLATLAAARRTRRSTETSLVITWHEAWDKDWHQEMGLVGHIGRRVERMVAGLPATHTTVSQHTADILVGIGRHAAAVIPSGVETAERQPSGPSGIPPSDVLFVGRLVPTKNLGLLIDATDHLVRRGIFPRVLVLGDGPHRSEWQDQVDRLGLNDCIDFVGTVQTEDEVMALLGSSKMLAVPSLREGFGMIALEAAAHGVPVVTVDHPRNAARHLVNHGVTGLVVSPAPAALAEAIQSLLEDDAVRQDMAREGAAMARRATWDAVVDDTEAVYEARVA